MLPMGEYLLQNLKETYGFFGNVQRLIIIYDFCFTIKYIDMIKKVSCRICNTVHEIEMTEEQNQDIKDGRKLIQRILPDPLYTSQDRELFISGFCDVCWDKVFPPEEEDDDDATSDEMALSGGCPDLEDREEEDAFKYGTLNHE